MGTTRRIIKEAEEAFKAHGMDIHRWAGLLSKMACGYREILEKDKDQLAREDVPPRYRPFLSSLDGRAVIIVDPATQLRALRLVGECLGLVAGIGQVSVNVAAGQGAIAGDNPTSQLGVVLIEGSGNKALEEAVLSLPSSERRSLLERLLLGNVVRPEIEHARLATSPGRIADAHAGEPG